MYLLEKRFFIKYFVNTLNVFREQGEVEEMWIKLTSLEIFAITLNNCQIGRFIHCISLFRTHLISLICGRLKQFKSSENRQAVAQRCSVKKVFLEISQNSQENTFFRVSLRPTILLKKRLSHICFRVSFENIPRTPFLTEHLR